MNSCPCFTARMIYYFYSYLFKSVQNKDFWKAGEYEQSGNDTDNCHLQYSRVVPARDFCPSSFGHISFMQGWCSPVSWVLRKYQPFSPSSPAEVFCEDIKTWQDIFIHLWTFLKEDQCSSWSASSNSISNLLIFLGQKGIIKKKKKARWVKQPLHEMQL